MKLNALKLFIVTVFIYACSSESQVKAEKIIDLPNRFVNDSIVDSMSSREFQKLELVRVIQSKVLKPKDSKSVYESAINSPKSAIFSKDGSKFYVNSLEGCVTAVFDSKTLKKIKTIKHQFNANNSSLFKNNENTVFGYAFKQKRAELNHFSGKPVESCLSHDGKYLWITYYRRNWDSKAESPSAVAIVDVEKDEIVRVMPSGPLPKMIACSSDNQLIAVTHWGDNTVGLIDISSADPMEFKYIAHIVVDYKLNLNFSSDSNRDSNCGNCLRGTAFTPDNQKLLIAKMSGNGIAVIDVPTKKYLGTITGSYLNLRHIVIQNGELFLSSNNYGVIQKAKLEDIFKTEFDDKKILNFSDWETVKVGVGARTLVVSPNGQYVFACVNNDCKIAVIETKTMKKIDEIPAAAFPVGLAISPDGTKLVSTSQGKSKTPGSGNTVMVFDIRYKSK
jgi:DNA-binding beta-propeller fold protein YncE